MLRQVKMFSAALKMKVTLKTTIFRSSKMIKNEYFGHFSLLYSTEVTVSTLNLSSCEQKLNSNGHVESFVLMNPRCFGNISIFA